MEVLRAWMEKRVRVVYKAGLQLEHNRSVDTHVSWVDRKLSCYYEKRD